MHVTVVARQAIAGIKAGKAEIGSGLSNLRKLLSRIARASTSGKMAKMSQDQERSAYYFEPEHST